MDQDTEKPIAVAAKPARPRCPACGSKSHYFRCKTGTYRCRGCGKAFRIEKEKVDEQQE